MNKYDPLSPKVLDFPRVSWIKGILKSNGLAKFGDFQLGRFYIYKLFHMVPMLSALCFGRPIDEKLLDEVEKLVSKFEIETPLKYAHPASYTTSNFDIGTHVHTIAERHFKNLGFEDLPFADQDILNGLVEITQGWKPIAVEEPLCSMKHQFRGTCDLIAEIDGRLTLVDVKTGKSKNGIFNDYDLQLAAYKIMYEEQTGQKIQDCAILMMYKDKSTWNFEYRNIHEGHVSTFLGARAAYDWHAAANASKKDVYERYNALKLGIQYEK